ncbi:MAG: NAD(+)/NADH kinase [Fusobacteria bacterium]|nr:NAD(+)/NADH kinase [Fusobacteriota bacterium]
MKSVFIVYNSYKDTSVKLYNDIKNKLKKLNIREENKENYKNADFMIVIGGDGTLLRASKYLVDENIPVIAINQGSLGFLTDIKTEETFEMINLFLENRYNYEERNFLELNVNNKIFYALNDIVISKNGILSRIKKIDLFSNGIYVNTYRADGIIFATPTGSTAYSLSSGGPIVHPKLKVTIITPIAPHTLSARPIIIDGDDIITFKVLENTDDLSITIDGQESINFTEKNMSIKLSKKKIILVKPENRDYYSILRTKLKWGDKLC